MTLPESANTTKIRFAAGSSPIAPVAVAKIAKVGVAPPLICTVTLGPIGEMQTPVTGSVWQMDSDRGRTAPPVFAVAVIMSPIPTFDVATANAPAPGAAGMCRIPSPLAVAASATMSGTGVDDADI